MKTLKLYLLKLLFAKEKIYLHIFFLNLTKQYKVKSSIPLAFEE